MAELTEISRYMLVVSTDILCLYAVLCLVLGKRRSAKAMLVFFLAKTVVVNILLNQIFGEYFAADPVRLSLYMVITLLTGIINYGMVCYTFHGSTAKILLVTIICEYIVSISGSLLMIGANILKKNPDIWEMGGSIDREDLLVPAGMCTLCVMLYKAGGKQLKKIRDYEVKHKKVWWLLWIVCTVTGNFSMLPTYNRTFALTVLLFFCIFMLLIICILLAGFHLWQLWRRKVRQKHQYLSRQRELMKLHGEAVRRQIDRMEGQQAEIDRQMERFLAMEDLTERNRTAAIYLRKLKEQYTAIRAGVYSDDYQIDSILYSYAGIFDRMGVNTEFSFGSYRGGCLDDEEAAAVLLELLDLAVRENAPAAPEKRSLRLLGGTVKNQAVFRMECPDGARRQMGSLKRRVKRLGGQMKVLRGGGRMSAEVLLNGEK